MTFLIYSGSRGFCPQGFHNVTLTSAITKRIVLNTILQNLGHSATFASLKSQNSNKFHGAVLNATSVQSSMAMSNTCIHASCCTHCPSLAENCSETGKSSADCSEKGQKMSGCVGLNCTLKQTNCVLFSQFRNNLGAVALLTCWKVLNDSK